MSAVIEIDLASPVPAFRQIADAVRARLVAGEVRAGEQLPTVRRLATDLGVHHNTVAEAYRLLAAEGWLDLGRGRGATVLDRAAPRATREAAGRFERRLGELAASARAEGVPAGKVGELLLELARSMGPARGRT